MSWAEVKKINSDLTTPLDIVIGTRQKPRGYGGIGSFSTTATSLTTALSVSGKGRLVNLAMDSTTGTGSSIVFRITIDGTVVMYAKNTTGSSDIPMASWFKYPRDGSTGITTATGAAHTPLNLEFKTSLLIEVLSVASSNTATIFWYYEKE